MILTPQQQSTKCTDTFFSFSWTHIDFKYLYFPFSLIYTSMV